ncbi:MAG: hypothetical protein PW734_05545 [Verrucomicrobium sp.]|nr:hypothetical protein [Verrucomicrobium sp.]
MDPAQLDSLLRELAEESAPVPASLSPAVWRAIRLRRGEEGWLSLLRPRLAALALLGAAALGVLTALPVSGPDEALRVFRGDVSGWMGGVR